MRKPLASALIVWAAIIRTCLPAASPIQWLKMKDIYRNLPNFFDDQLRAKVLKTSPADLLLYGKDRSQKLLQTFSLEERELNIPCGLYKWINYAKRSVLLLGTEEEKKTLAKLETAVSKKLNRQLIEKCANIRSYNHRT